MNTTTKGSSMRAVIYVGDDRLAVGDCYVTALQAFRAATAAVERRWIQIAPRIADGEVLSIKVEVL